MSEDGWSHLSIDEKFSSIRQDLRNLLSGYEDLNDRLASIGHHLGRIETIATQAAKEAEELKARLSTSGGGTGASL